MLNILLIVDGKPGHESISKGLAKTIGDNININITEIKSKLRFKFLKRFATYICTNLTNKSNIILWINIFYKDIIVNKKEKYDLIISTGGDTSFLNVLISKYLSVPNIYCSSLRKLNPSLFTNIISIIDHNIENEIVVDLPPIYMKLKEKELEGKYIALLIGGATTNHKFTNDEFIKLVEDTVYLARQNNYKILITTSRRTPIIVENIIEDICFKNNDIVYKYVLFNKKPEKVVNYFLSNSEIVFCTEDSGSMISEAIVASKKVYTIRPKEIKLEKIFDSFISNLISKRLVIVKDVNEVRNISFIGDDFSTLDHNPSEYVYHKIKDNF